MFVCVALQFSALPRAGERRVHPAARPAQKSVRGVAPLELASCEAPQVLNLRGDGCVASTACHAGSTAVDGRCKCSSESTIPNLAGSACVAYGACGANATTEWSSENPVSMCVCSEWAGFAMNAEKTGCNCATATPVYDPVGERCIAEAGTCQGENYVVNAAKTACVCAAGKILHIEGTCNAIACGSFQHEAEISAGVCGCKGEWPIADKRGKKCIQAGDYCSDTFEEAVNATAGRCVDMYDQTQCKKLSLNLQKCLDSCSETGAADLTGTSYCVCKAGYAMKDGACVATTAISCPKPNFFHVDGQCNALLCGSSIIGEALIEGTSVCQCNGGLPYFGMCYITEEEGYVCAEGYMPYEGSGACVSAKACADVIGGAVQDEDGAKYCTCQSPKVLSLSGGRCVEAAGCPANAEAGSYSCRCKEGFVQLKDACVAITVCADGKVFNLQRNGCVTGAECLAAGGEVEEDAYNDVPFKLCECNNLLSPGGDQCTSWLPGKCGGNAYVVAGDESLSCACLDGYRLEKGACVRGREACASPNFQHVDGTCTAKACGTIGIAGEISDASNANVCKCDGKTPLLDATKQTCIASCATGQLVDKLEGASACVTLCPYESPHNKDNECVDSCSGMYRADAEKLCAMHKGKLAAAIAVPVVAVVCAAAVVAVWLIVRKKRNVNKKQPSEIKSIQDKEIFSRNSGAKPKLAMPFQE